MDTVMNPALRYEPDYVVPTGYVIADHLEAPGMSQAELARRCGRSRKWVSQVIAGKAPVLADAAVQLERALGLDASVWLGIESDYRLAIARQRYAESSSGATQR